VVGEEIPIKGLDSMIDGDNDRVVSFRRVNGNVGGAVELKK
jgi:hypothetical protein